jgi:hypothetical protein
MPADPAARPGAPRRTARRRTAAAGLVTAFAVLAALPLPGVAGLLPGDQSTTDKDKLAQTTAKLDGTLDRAVQQVADAVAPVAAPVSMAVQQVRAVKSAPAPAAKPAAAGPRAEDPQTQPPLHGTNPHGQGTVANVDLTPKSDRPLSGDTTGKDSGEEIIVGRARGEQGTDGTYHGHITIVGLFGNEVVGVDSKPGETKAGPLDALQTGLLDAICNGSAQQVCLNVARADSATTSSGSTNTFQTAHATLGGAGGLDVGAAESHGNASSDATCQTTHGDSTVANVNAGGTAVASLAQSSTDSKACKGQAPVQTNKSSVLGLGGTGVPIPAPGCADGTPDTSTGIPTLLPIICNADDNGAQATAPVGVRDALTVFALATGTSSVLRTATAGSESHAVAPPVQCADGVDNDGDGLVDAADGGCHSDGNPDNPASYDSSDDDESGGNTPGAGGSGNPSNGGETPGNKGSGGPACSDGKDNDGDGKVDAADPGCHTDGNPNNASSFNPKDRSEGGNGGGTQCSDGVDNDGDGRVDAADPGCHSDGDASNPRSYVPGDDSELDSARKLNGTLPFTGSDVLGLALAGLVLLASGLVVRRRFGEG